MAAQVHCCACLRNGERNGSACRFCGSEDIFTAAQLLQGEYEERARKSTGAEAMWGFILDEWNALEKRAQTAPVAKPKAPKKQRQR